MLWSKSSTAIAIMHQSELVEQVYAIRGHVGSFFFNSFFNKSIKISSRLVLYKVESGVKSCRVRLV